jgi:ankyrin repeat protein
MPTESTALDELLDAIVFDEVATVRLVRKTPALARTLVVRERLVKEIPHQLYAGDTALHVAAAAVRPLAVAALIDAGANANAANRRGAIALHYACDSRPRSEHACDASSQRRVIELLLDAGSDIEHTDKSGTAPLHRAVRARSVEAVRCLLERGARADATHGRQRTTPLHIVSHSTGSSGTKGTRAEQLAIVELLIRFGANPRARDAKGNLARI